MAEIFSNTFTTNINKVIVAETDKNTQIIIMKNKVELAAVNSTPTTGQYKVTIAETKNCTARLENDYKTITLLTATGNSGEIKLSINIEGKKTISKIIPVASITNSNTISTYYSEQQQLANKFTWLVKSGTSSSNMELTDAAYKLVSKNIDLEGYTTINGGFKIDLEGNMEAKNGKFSGKITGSTLSTTAVNGKYVSVKTSDYSVFNNNKKVISMGLKDLTYSNSTTGETTNTTNTPCIYIGADGFNSSGGTSYTGQTGRYYGMIQSYNHLNSIASSYKGYYQVPYLNFRYNTSYSASDGTPATSNMRMFANGDIMLAPVKNLIIKTNRTDGAINPNGTTEYEVAKFYSSASSYFNSAMQVQAVINKNNSSGLCIGDADDPNNRSAYFFAKVGNTTDGGNYRTWKPHLDATSWLGTSTYRWKTLYLSGSTIQTSDRRSKENVEYITNVSNPKAKMNSTYTVEDICDFVKNIPYATFNMIGDEDKEKRIGFILQDIVDNDICRDLILDGESLRIEQNAKTDKQPYMGFNQANYISMLGLALQEEIKKREALEDKLAEILEKIDGLNEG